MSHARTGRHYRMTLNKLCMRWRRARTPSASRMPHRRPQASPANSQPVHHQKPKKRPSQIQRCVGDFVAGAQTSEVCPCSVEAVCRHALEGLTTVRGAPPTPPSPSPRTPLHPPSHRRRRVVSPSVCTRPPPPLCLCVSDRLNALYGCFNTPLNPPVGSRLIRMFSVYRLLTV